MTGAIRTVVVSAITASALVLGGGAAFAHDGDHAAFKECLAANIAAAGSDGAVAGSIKHCVASEASSG